MISLLTLAKKIVTVVGYVVIVPIKFFSQLAKNFGRFGKNIGSWLSHRIKPVLGKSKKLLLTKVSFPKFTFFRGFQGKLRKKLSNSSFKFKLPKFSLKKLKKPNFSGLGISFGNLFSGMAVWIKKLLVRKKTQRQQPVEKPKFEADVVNSDHSELHSRTNSKKMSRTQLKLLSVNQKIQWLFEKIEKLIKVALIFTAGFAAAIVFVFIPSIVGKWLRELPNPELLVVDGSAKSTKILDRNGKLLYEIYVDKNYDPVRLDKIPKHVKNATLAVEDATFYSHVGFRPESMLRAAKETLFKKNTQGASTITQQLIKNVLLSPERTYTRKIKELVLAVLVETKYTKDEIFELYLNNISYGGTAWGIQSASHKFFGKDVWELNLAEASMLAGLPSAPTTYSPRVNLDLAKQRQRYVLDRMVELKYISKEESDSAFAEELKFIEDYQYIRAPHFVDFTRKTLEEKFGTRMVSLGGLTVTTTLDLDLQEKAQNIVTSEVAASSYLKISNGSAVVLDSKNAEILAYVGSVDYFKTGWGAYDVASAYRQPGSSIKPVTYALALAQGYTPVSIINDSPVTFQIKGSAPYTPVNYDGSFHGNVTLRAALANSYNIPAVRLAAAVGPDNVVSLGRDMGLTNWEVDSSYGLSVTLGGKEVRPVDLANAYGTFARRGEFKEVTPLLSVKDNKGYEIYNSTPKKTRRVLSEEVAYLIWHILSDNNARLPAFGTRNNLVIPNHRIAVKTGTTDSKRDNWTVGFTPSYVVAVWVGNNDNAPMNPYLASGLSGAAPIWNKIFAAVLEGKPDEQMKMPDGVFAKTDGSCGVTDVFIKGTNVPATLCYKPDDESKDKDKKDKKKKD